MSQLSPIQSARRSPRKVGAAALVALAIVLCAPPAASAASWTNSAPKASWTNSAPKASWTNGAPKASWTNGAPKASWTNGAGSSARAS